MDILSVLQGFSKFLPQVKAPEKPLGIKDKLFWTVISLVVFFMMYNTTAIGVRHDFATLDFLQTITASRIGSLLTAGIGPIVLAGIFLQLFSGAGIIKVDLKDKNDRQKFQDSQKVLAIILAFAEALIFVYGGRTPLVPIFSSMGDAIDPATGIATVATAPITALLVILQIALGSILVLYLDELMNKYGIGSGISLFIAAGVSLTILSGSAELLFGSATNSVLKIVSSGGADALPSALLTMLPFWFTIIVFLICVYAESLKVEIPLSYESVRGMVPKLPLKFFYVSNIPVIFASALILNVQLFAGSVLVPMYYEDGISKYDFSAGYSFDKHGILPIIAHVAPNGAIDDGILSFISPPFGRNIFLSFNQISPIFHIPFWVHGLIYVVFLALFAVMFGLFWVEVAGMDAKSMSGQLTGSGFQIPGFRRDPRMLEQVLNKNIFPLTVIGSFTVGLLAGFADLTGALGTGTGILLTVGILHKMYEDLEKQKIFEMYPSITSFMGKSE